MKSWFGIAAMLAASACTGGGTLAPTGGGTVNLKQVTKIDVSLAAFSSQTTPAGSALGFSPEVTSVSVGFWRAIRQRRQHLTYGDVDPGGIHVSADISVRDFRDDSERVGKSFRRLEQRHDACGERLASVPRRSARHVSLRLLLSL